MEADQFIRNLAKLERLVAIKKCNTKSVTC
jgi:hypothetical protein